VTDYNFFDHPILNSPYEYPARHWELDESGQPTNRIIDRRRKVDLVTPIPKPKKSKGKQGAAGETSQKEFVFDEGKGLSTAQQQYEATTTVVNEIRGYVDQWRQLRNESDWLVTPETARLLRHWRTHEFERLRPFFCQVEAVEALKTTLKAEIDEAAWETIHSDTSRPFVKPASGRVAVKVINHLGDEVMKVYSVPSRAPAVTTS
jgi:type III restriction enzyme